MKDVPLLVYCCEIMAGDYGEVHVVVASGDDSLIGDSLLVRSQSAINAAGREERSVCSCASCVDIVK